MFFTHSYVYSIAGKTASVNRDDDTCIIFFLWCDYYMHAYFYSKRRRMPLLPGDEIFCLCSAYKKTTLFLRRIVSLVFRLFLSVRKNRVDDAVMCLSACAYDYAVVGDAVVDRKRRFRMDIDIACRYIVVGAIIE